MPVKSTGPVSRGTHPSPALIEAVKLLLAARSGSFADRTWRIMTFHLIVMIVNSREELGEHLYRLMLCTACIAIVFIFQFLEERFLLCSRTHDPPSGRE
jgi:hypothetical protein